MGRLSYVAALCAAVAMAPAEASAQSRPDRAPGMLPAAPAMLDTSTVPIRAERFAVELGRARQDGRSLPAIQKLVDELYQAPPAVIDRVKDILAKD